MQPIFYFRHKFQFLGNKNVHRSRFQEFKSNQVGRNTLKVDNILFYKDLIVGLPDGIPFAYDDMHTLKIAKTRRT